MADELQKLAERYEGGYCGNKSCNGSLQEVEITDEHREKSSAKYEHSSLSTVMECSDCSFTRFWYELD